MKKLRSSRIITMQYSRNISAFVLWISLVVAGTAGTEIIRAPGNDWAPEIIADTDELVINVGGKLNLTCRDREPVVWATNEDSLLYDNYDELYEPGHEKPHIVNLVFENINYTNVGYYFCIHNTTENKENQEKREWSSTDTNVSAIYVYVKDEDHLLAKEAEVVFYRPVVNQTFTFPCKPTFPEVEVKLEKIQGVFDPRKGFTVVADGTEDYLECTAVYGMLDDSRDFIIQHKPLIEETLERPKVKVTGAWQKDSISMHTGNEHEEHYDIEEGSSVNLTCTYNHAMVTTRYLDWKMPPTVSNKSGNHLIYRDFETGQFLIRVHSIINANPDRDSGAYRCIARNNGKTFSDPFIVVVNVLPLDYANVTLKPDEPHVVEAPEDGDSVRWHVDYRSYPDPILIWRKGEEVLVDSSNKNKGDKRYKLDSDLQQGTVFLEISSRTNDDIGNYTLEALIKEKGRIIARDDVRLSFTMPVPPLPPSIEILPKDGEMFSKELEFDLICKSQGYPKPHISVEFAQCFSKGNCSEFQTIHQDQESGNFIKEMPFEVREQSEVNVTAKWRGLAFIQGRYRCFAENEHGYEDSETKEFLVTDGGHGNPSLELSVNGIQAPGAVQEVLEADNITVRCRGNKFRTSPSFKWTLNGAPLDIMNAPGGLKMTLNQADTDLSFVSELRIADIPLGEEALHFTCMDAANSSRTAKQTLKVNPMEAPEWEAGEPLKDLDLTEMESYVLECPASGAPTPYVRWYKNGKLLQEADETDRKHRFVQDSKITFGYLKIEDSGRYKCEVINRAGRIESEAQISVVDPDAFANSTIIIVVGVLSLVVILLSIFFCVKIYKDRKRAHSIRLADQRMFLEGDPDNINPDLGLDEQAELLPYDTKYEVSRDSIVFDKLLGAGAFGRVYRAKAMNLIPGKASTTVAVKMMKSRTDCAQLKALRSEVKIMIHIGRHVNIVNLLGACSKDLASKGELLLLVEYCKYGNLLDYMRRHRKDFINQINEYDKIDTSLGDARLRHRSESGSRSRTSRGLKYAHLSFNQDSVAYTPGQDAISEHSGPQALWMEPTSPTGSIGTNGHIPGHIPEAFRSRTVSGSSGFHVTSDMSAMTYESSTGTMDGYVGSRSVGPNSTPLCSKELLCWAFQVAKGMEYLSYKKVLHGDLAARNILLAEDNIVKISDFGLAKDIYKNDNYWKKSKTPLPWKWLALESFRDGVFSTQSDIWSYGVVLWEIFSLGQVPYPGLDCDEAFVAKLEKGVRLEQPKYATYDLYRIMMDCWNNEPMDRPSFSMLEERLGAMLGEAEKQHYLELNTPYQEDNLTSNILQMLQTPDYASKIREKTPNLDAEGYEVPFSPSPLGAMALPPGLSPGLDSIHSPRLTPMQVAYQKGFDGIDSEDSAGIYLPMSSPSKETSSVFSFDKETVDSINKRDSEIQQQSEGIIDGVDGEMKDTYLPMQHSPLSTNSPGYNEQPKVAVPMRHKLVRTASQMEKHDSGLYSPTACMQSNPHYMIMDNFLKTDKNNYLTKDDVFDSEYDKPTYINLDEVNQSSKLFKKNYAKDGLCNGEYTNLLPNGNVRGRTLSESSSGLGSISEESPPECRSIQNSLKSSLIENAIKEEPICA